MQEVVREMLSAIRDTFSLPRPFPEATVEAEFREHFARRFIAYRRAAAILGPLIWISFIPVDIAEQAASSLFYTQEQLRSVLILRVAVFLLLVPLVVATFTRWFETERGATAVLLAGVGLGGAGTLGLIVLIPPEINYRVLVSLPTLLIFVFAFAHLRALAATSLGVGIGAALVLGVIPSGALANDSVDAVVNYVAVYGLCHGVVVKMERYARERFVRERELVRLVSDAGAARERAEEQRQRADANAGLLVRLKEEQRLAAESASAEKSRFLAEAAHDLRQPMQAIGSLVDAAGQAIAADRIDRAGELVADARNAIRIMRTSFNAVLEISRLESRITKPEYSNVELGLLLHEVAESSRPLAERNRVEVRLHSRDEKRIVVRSDRNLLFRVVSNLVANGIKYRNPEATGGSRLLVGVVCLPTKIRVDIVDNGIGIDRQHWDRVFSPFFQVDNPGHDRERGLGLGLSIVQASIALLGQHRIELKSALGKGTRFSLELPRVSVEKARNVSLIDRGEDKGFDLRGTYLLFVEDDMLVRRSIEALLEQNGVLYETASSLDELRKLVPSMVRNPDLLLSDYRLAEGFTAEDAINYVRAEFGENLPAIVLTAEISQLGEFQSAPNLFVLHKPISSEQLFELMRQAVGER